MNNNNDKFTPKNKTKLLDSLKRHIHKKLGYQYNTSDLQQIINDTIAFVNEENPNARLKDFNKKVLIHSARRIKATYQETPQPIQSNETTRGSGVNSAYEQITKERQNEGKLNIQPIDFTIKQDEPITNPLEELKKLQENRTSLDQSYKNNEGTSIDKLFQQIEENNNEEPKPQDSFESQFSNILGASKKEENIIIPKEEIKTIKFTDQTFKNKKTPSGVAKNGEQNLIIPRTIQQSYYDKEHTLVIYGLDRNWTNIEENRYNFNVKFHGRSDARSIQQKGTASTQETFKNIVSMKLVRANLPNERLTQLVELNSNGPTFTRNNNALQYPFINLDIGSFNGEMQGTNPTINNSFTNLIVDQNYRNDTTDKNTGYLSFISSDEKQKRLFYPTPLSDIKTMRVQLKTPTGELLSQTQDRFTVEKIILGSADLSGEGTYTDISNTGYYADLSNNNNEPENINYIWIKTSSHFPISNFNIGEKVVFTGFTVDNSDNNIPNTTRIGFENFINRKEGHHVVQVAHIENNTDLSQSFIKETGNIVGYANYIIIPLELNSPETGNLTRKTYGSNTQEIALFNDIRLNPQSNCYGINTNRQIQLVFNIITRNFDGSELQPQNI